jgi:chromosome segregation ATPase
MTDPKEPEGATPEEPTDPKPEADKPEPEELGTNGKDALRKEREARKAAEDRAKAAEARVAEIDAEQAKKSEDEAKAKGEFEKLANERQAKLEKLQNDHKTLAEERDALAARVQAYEDRDRERLEKALKDLSPELKSTDPINFDPDVSLTARLKWLDVQLETAAKRVTDPTRGNGRSPEPANGRDAKADEAARLQSQRQALRGF